MLVSIFMMVSLFLVSIHSEPLLIFLGGVWAVSLAVSGLASIVDIYHDNVLFTSSTGANPQTGGLKSIRAWEPNPDPKHPPDP